MKNVVWGIGYYGRLCAINMGLDNVSFFIDSDRSKSGFFLGKKVMTPDILSDWKGVHLFIPESYKIEVIEKLKEYDVQSLATITIYSQNAQMSEYIATKEFTRAMNEVNKAVVDDLHDGVVFWSRMWSVDRSYAIGYRQLIKNIKMLVVSEAYWINIQETENILKQQAIVAPAFSASGAINIKSVSSPPNKYNVDDNSINEFVKSIIATNPNLAHKDAYYKAYLTYTFMEAVLKKGKFKYAIIYASDTPEHRVLSSLCDKYGIKTIYTHPSVLPGTLSFDPSGDVGDSIISTYHREFLELPISDKDLSFAKRVLDYLFETGINRKPQPKHNWLQLVQSRIKINRPTVFYAGQLDLDCSMIPYTERTKKFHSPIFKSTFECALFLSKICLRNNWNFIYKPHPMFIGDGDKGLPSNVIYVSSGDINEIVDFADVTVTIRSTTNYVALVRGKPVLMLGYTQTRGQGCTYEAFKKEHIEAELREAVKNGFTPIQKQKFLEHVARLLKYYLYDDMGDRGIRFGLSYPENIDGFFKLKEKLEAMKNKRYSYEEEDGIDNKGFGGSAFWVSEGKK